VGFFELAAGKGFFVAALADLFAGFAVALPGSLPAAFGAGVVAGGAVGNAACTVLGLAGFLAAATGFDKVLVMMVFQLV
jgi:hypothetical protein